MKNTDIAKIRQLLQDALTYQKKRKIKHPDSRDATNMYKWILKDMSECVQAALALLPCPTCNGMGIMMKCVVDGDGVLLSQDPEPCNDCQKKPIDKSS